MMSGTSLDGVDAAAVDTDGDDVVATGAFVSVPFDQGLRERLHALKGRPSVDNEETRDAERRLTLFHADVVRKLISEHPEVGSAELIGFHGQTVFHAPERGLTCQIGDGELLARETGIPVIDDFRSADVAAGGEGAPMAPVYHVARARDLERPVAVLNIGGVANVTWISPDGGAIAFDTGPGNALIDDWVSARGDAIMDLGGACARAGRVDSAVLERLLDNAYFDRPYPKSLDRDAFSLEPAGDLSLEDGAATLTAFTAVAVARSARELPSRPLRWLVCGGGRKNPVMMHDLRTALESPVEPVEAVGWNGDAIEAEAFAFLAARSKKGLPLSYPQTTGVAMPVSGGVYHHP